MSTNPPPYYPQAPVQRRTSPVVWILAILGVLVMLVILAVGGISFYVAHKIKQAGLDSDTMKRNPVVATVKVMAALNPNIEIVALDEDKGFVTVREKKSGRTFHVNFDDAKRGRFTMQEDGKEPITITASGQDNNGTVELKSQDGTVKIGGGQDVKIPAWVPDYPHSDARGAFASQSSSGLSGTYGFRTHDSASKVMKFYEDGFRSEGMEVNRQTGNVLTAEREGKSAVIVVTSDGGESSVSVTFKAKVHGS